MKDLFGRNVDTLRVSVTDQCQLRCFYCFTKEDTCLQRDCRETLSKDEIVSFISFAAKNYGIKRIRFTGGEPLLRSDLDEIIFNVSQIEGITDIALTTNGVLLGDKIENLKKANLKRINVGVDTFDPETFLMMTSIKGNLETAKKLINDIKNNILKADATGIHPIKINSVINNKTDFERDIKPISDWATKNNFIHQLIPQMDLSKGHFSKVYESPYSVIKNIDLISSGGNCNTCRRLRLNSKGDLKSCLFGDNNFFNIKDLGFKKALDQAIEKRVLCGGMASQNNFFYELGG